MEILSDCHPLDDIVDEGDVVGDRPAVDRGEDAEGRQGAHDLGLAAVLEGEPHLGAVPAHRQVRRERAGLRHPGHDTVGLGIDDVDLGGEAGGNEGVSCGDRPMYTATLTLLVAVSMR
ncbi:hypothetical protein ACFWWB_37795 [Streptomyces sp. NPDC058690]|uniref:hypothetical protein n=1 Tax=Streptomyces sp. NPDC058690 TaxID=3346600 RepID=UPI003649EFE8